MPPDPDRPLRILHLILVLGETNSQYHEHCLPMIGERELSICTYFAPRLRPSPGIRLFPGDGSLRGFFRALREALDEGEYDAVHAHSPHTGLLLTVALLAWGRYPRLRASLVYTVHDAFYDYKPRNQALMVLSLPAFHRVVFCSRSAYESLPRAWRWLVRGRWRVVRNGADADRVRRVIAAGPVCRDPDRFTVLSVGRLEKVKDPPALLDAFATGAGPKGDMVFVGAGPLEAALRDRAEALGCAERVRFTGLIPRDEVFLRCAGADVFVSASHGEGLPVAAMEAMASGCPVVLSDIPPHRELAEGTDVIPLVRPGSAEDFAWQIQRFRRMRREDRLEIGRRCREHVATRFSLPRMHAGYEAVYRELSGAPVQEAGVP